MKIISKFRDYYDSAMAFGHDDHIYFKRVKEEHVDVKMEDYSFVIREIYKSLISNESFGDYTYDTALIFFCGKTYHTIIFSEYNQTTYKTNKTYIYSYDDFVKYVDSKKDKKMTKWFYEESVYGRLRSRRKTHAEYFEKYFEKSSKYNNQDDSIFVEMNSPYFMFANHDRRIDFTNHPNLKDIHFQKIFEPYTCYQEIEMYLGNVLCNTEDNTVQICDKDMRNQKGFDDWSFKKMPTKKRKGK